MKFWSRRQKAMSLSSWECEPYAAATTGVETIGLQSGLRVLESESEERMRQFRSRGPHSSTRIWAGKERANEASLASNSPR